MNPLGYVRDGQDMLVVGSRGGDSRHPDWYWNLKAEPNAMAEVGSQVIPVIRLWATVTAVMPPMLAYQQQTSRRLPIIRLSPAEATSPEFRRC